MHEPIRTSTYYRTDDPLENLQLRIVIYEVIGEYSYQDHFYCLYNLKKYYLGVDIEASKL